MKYSSIQRLGLLGWLLALAVASAQAGETDSTRVGPLCCSHRGCSAENRAPLGIMTDHLHGAGDWAFSYSFMNMAMLGNLSGARALSTDAVLKDYAMAPTSMRMQMHMFMAMYGWSDRLTLMGMLNYNRNDMSMAMAPMDQMMNMPGMENMDMADMPTRMRTSGLGDTKLMALYELANSGRHRLILSAGVSIPTGSSAQNGTTMLGENTRLPYMMQLGTGTWDLLPAITYTGRRYQWRWGAEAGATIPTGKNAQGYNWGMQFRASAWAGYRLLPWATGSLRVEGLAAGSIMGYDPKIAPLMLNDPCADAAHSGGQRVNLLVGLNFFRFIPRLPGATIQIECGMPVYQHLNGPQMRPANTVQVGCMYAL